MSPLPTGVLAFLQNIGPVGLIVILVIALLIFGKRLPDVARSLGKGIVEFKKGLRGVEDEIDRASREPPPPPPRDESYSSSRSGSGSQESQPKD